MAEEIRSLTSSELRVHPHRGPPRPSPRPTRSPADDGWTSAGGPDGYERLRLRPQARPARGWVRSRRMELRSTGAARSPGPSPTPPTRTPRHREDSSVGPGRAPSPGGSACIVRTSNRARVAWLRSDTTMIRSQWRWRPGRLVYSASPRVSRGSARKQMTATWATGVDRRRLCCPRGRSRPRARTPAGPAMIAVFARSCPLSPPKATTASADLVAGPSGAR